MMCSMSQTFDPRVVIAYLYESGATSKTEREESFFSALKWRTYLMLRFALSLYYVSGTLNTALNGLLLVTPPICQVCNIFLGCAVRMQRTIGEFQPSRPVI